MTEVIRTSETPVTLYDSTKRSFPGDVHISVKFSLDYDRY
jgi:hypothetical protein